MEDYSIENKQIILTELSAEREENLSRHTNCLTRCNILLVIFSVLFVKFLDIVSNTFILLPDLLLFIGISVAFYYKFYLIIKGEKTKDFSISNNDIDLSIEEKSIFRSLCKQLLETIEEDRKNIENKLKNLRDMTLLVILFSIGLIFLSI